MLSGKIPIMPSQYSLIGHFDRGAMVRAAADEAIGSVKQHPPAPNAGRELGHHASEPTHPIIIGPQSLLSVMPVMALPMPDQP